MNYFQQLLFYQTTPKKKEVEKYKIGISRLPHCILSSTRSHDYSLICSSDAICVEKKPKFIVLIDRDNKTNFDGGIN